MNRDFKGVWFPKEIWLNKGLSLVEKALLIEIDSLDNGDDHCFASNAYLSEFASCSVDTVSRAIKKLVASGFLSVEMRRDGNASQRVIISCLAIRKMRRPPPQNAETPPPQNAEHSIIPVLRHDQNNDKEPPNPLEGGSARKRAPAVIDPLYHPIEQAFLSKGNFADYKKESVCIKAIVKKIRNLTPESPERTADKVLSTFLTLKSGNDKFWNQRPFLPSGLSPVLEQVWSVAQKTASLSDVSYVERLRKEG